MLSTESRVQRRRSGECAILVRDLYAARASNKVMMLPLATPTFAVIRCAVACAVRVVSSVLYPCSRYGLAARTILHSVKHIRISYMRAPNPTQPQPARPLRGANRARFQTAMYFMCRCGVLCAQSQDTRARHLRSE